MGILLLKSSICRPCRSEAACWRLCEKNAVTQVSIPEREWDLAPLSTERCSPVSDTPVLSKGPKKPHGTATVQICPPSPAKPRSWHQRPWVRKVAAEPAPAIMLGMDLALCSPKIREVQNGTGCCREHPQRTTSATPGVNSDLHIGLVTNIPPTNTSLLPVTAPIQTRCRPNKVMRAFLVILCTETEGCEEQGDPRL